MAGILGGEDPGSFVNRPEGEREGEAADAQKCGNQQSDDYILHVLCSTFAQSEPEALPELHRGKRQTSSKAKPIVLRVMCNFSLSDGQYHTALRDVNDNRAEISLAGLTVGSLNNRRRFSEGNRTVHDHGHE